DDRRAQPKAVVSRRSTQHPDQYPPQYPARYPPQRGGRHRKPSRTRSALRNPVLRVAAVVATAAAVALFAIDLGDRSPSPAGDPAALGRAATSTPSGSSGHLGQPVVIRDGLAQASGRDTGRGAHHARSGGHAAHRGARAGLAAYYRNPLRAITGLLPERID